MILKIVFLSFKIPKIYGIIILVRGIVKCICVMCLYATIWSFVAYINFVLTWRCLTEIHIIDGDKGIKHINKISYTFPVFIHLCTWFSQI